jgi:hypothetical protein
MNVEACGRKREPSVGCGAYRPKELPTDPRVGLAALAPPRVLDPELQSDETRDARKLNKRRAAPRASLDTTDPGLADRGRSCHFTLAEAGRQPGLADFATHLTRELVTTRFGIRESPPATRHSAMVLFGAYGSITASLVAARRLLADPAAVGRSAWTCRGVDRRQQIRVCPVASNRFGASDALLCGKR